MSKTTAAVETTLDFIHFLWWYFRPRAIRGRFRLGSSFECICYSFDYMKLQNHARRERLNKFEQIYVY